MKSNLLRNLIIVPAVISTSFSLSWCAGPYKDLVSKYDFAKKLGSGNQGSVCLYKCKADNGHVAIKKISKSNSQACESEKLAYEYREILGKCPYFSKPIEYFEDNNYFYFVYEYIDGFGVFDQNKLKEYVKHLSNNVDIFMCKITLQFMIAFKDLYENELSYGDLRSGNIILIDDKISDVPVIKIIDYGYFGSGNNKINERGWDLLSDLLDEICDTVLRSLGLDDEDEIFETPNTLQFIRRLKGSFINWNRNPYYYNMRKKWKEENLEFKTYDEAIDFLQQVISNSEV